MAARAIPSSTMRFSPQSPKQPGRTWHQRAWHLACFLAIFCMLLLAGEHLAARFADSPLDFCGLVEGWGCRETIQHPWSAFLGLPVALWAVSLYTILIQLAPSTWTRRGNRLTALLLLAALCSGSIIFLFLMERDFTTPCPMCLGAHASHLLLAAIALAAARALKKATAPEEAGGIRKTTFTPSLLVLLAGFAAVSISDRIEAKQSLSRQLADPAFLGPIIDYTGDRYFPERSDQLIAGQSTAPNRLTIIGSLSCRHCRALLGQVQALPASTLQSTSIAFVPYPLAAACNPAAAKAGLPRHPERCRLAALTNRAQANSAFWNWFRTVDGAPGRTLRRLKNEANTTPPDRQLAAQLAAANGIPVPRIPLLLWNGMPLPALLARLPLADLIKLLMDAQQNKSANPPEECDC